MSVFALPRKKNSLILNLHDSHLFKFFLCNILQEKRNNHVFILYIHLYTDCIYTSTKHRKSCFSRSNDHTHRLLHDYRYEWSPAYGTVVDGSAVFQCQRTDTQHLLKDRQKIPPRYRINNTPKSSVTAVSRHLQTAVAT